MKKQSQNEVILDHLIRKKTINPLQALKLYGCFRLSARIFDLKEKGINIEKNSEKDRSTGKEYAVYTLVSR
tara:strand:- start:379 stop:591 length:213 start_codon:yes stop_codon:yes gene_type:complete